MAIAIEVITLRYDHNFNGRYHYFTAAEGDDETAQMKYAHDFIDYWVMPCITQFRARIVTVPDAHWHQMRKTPFAYSDHVQWRKFPPVPKIGREIWRPTITKEMLYSVY